MSALLLFRRASGRVLALPRVLLAYVLVPLPTLWLLCQIFGALPHAVGDFPAPGYLAFVAPALAVTGALPLSIRAGAWVLDDRDAGLLEQLLTAPVSQTALVLDELLAHAIGAALTVPVVLLAARAAGMAPQTGMLGALALVPLALTLNGLYAALSLALAAVLPRQDMLLRGMGLLVCASVVFSDLLLPAGLLPHWLITISHANPVTYAIHGARSALGPAPSWSSYARDLLALACALSAATTAALALHVRQATRWLAPAAA